MILKVFIDYFFVKIVVGWSKNLCNLIITVGFNFYANLTVRSSLNCKDQSITVGSSQDFKSDSFDISPIFYRKIKLTRVCATDPIFSRYIGRYIADITDFFPIFPSNDYRLPILCRILLISDISTIYRLFLTLCGTDVRSYQNLIHK